jgi:hypothetical protein
MTPPEFRAMAQPPVLEATQPSPPQERVATNLAGIKQDLAKLKEVIERYSLV